MLSVSVAEISVEEEAKILPVLCSDTRELLNKNAATNAYFSTDTYLSYSKCSSEITLKPL